MERPVDLVIRFTAAIPDQIITVDDANATSGLSIKQLIRPHLPSNLNASRLRLISAGKVLNDSNALSQSIAIPPPPPQARAFPDSKGKGKAPALSPPLQQRSRVYVHCSIGDALDDDQLEAEVISARIADEGFVAQTSGPHATEVTQRGDGKHIKTTQAGLRGFERLLDAGFDAEEVATLRTQFMAIQAHTHTPDTMPVGDELRALEDRWLDSDGNNAAGAATAGDGEGGFGAEDGGLEDMLWGNIMGFFWPVAAVCWLMREEGVWSRRRQIAVLSGMLVNITFGFLRLTN